MHMESKTQSDNRVHECLHEMVIIIFFFLYSGQAWVSKLKIQVVHDPTPVACC